MRTIAIINQKGGCGKTTVSINLAATLAAKGHRTLLVDMDPQSHCAMGLAVPDNQIDRSIADMLKAGLDGSLAFADIVWQIARHFDLAPSTIALAGIEQQLATAPDKDRRLVQVLSTVQDRYDFCVVDCPPSIGLLTFNALRAADEVLIPVETGYFSMQGSIRQEQTVEMLARRAGHHVRFKVLATMYDVRTKLAREILSELKRHFGEKLLPVVINFNSKLKEAASFGQPITEYDAASRGMQDFERLAAWLLANPPQPPEGVQGEQADSGTRNPALSRAAELVERARALSARTAALAARLHSDGDVPDEPASAPAPPSSSAGRREPVVRTRPGAAEPDEPENDPHLEFDPEALDVGTPRPAGAPATAPRRVAEPEPRIQQRVARLYGVKTTAQGLLFVQPAKGARQMAIAGDFNGWDPQVTPMQRDDAMGVWQACVQVPPGRYRYRLVIDGQWVRDPYNGVVEANLFGELNNVIEVGLEESRESVQS